MSIIRVAMIVSDEREVAQEYTAPAPSFGPSPHLLLSGLSQMPGVEVHTISCTQQPVESPDRIFDTIRHHSLRVRKWGWLRGGYVGCVRAIGKRLRELRVDLVHGQGTERYCGLAAAWSGYPNLITVHGNMRRIARLSGVSAFSFMGLTAFLEGLTLRKSGGVLYLSEHTRLQVAPLTARTYRAYNAIDPGLLDLPRAPDTPPMLLCPATVQPIKNQLKLIEALDALAGRVSFRVVFLGKKAEGDPYGDEFSRRVQARSWCEYAGHAGREELVGRLRRATMVVLPSIEDNSPMVVLEAMAAGVPVAASRIGGIPDLIEEGRTGVLFNPNDPADIGSKVGMLLADSVQAEALARAARDWAAGHFLPKHVALGHVEIYRTFLRDLGVGVWRGGER